MANGTRLGLTRIRVLGEACVAKERERMDGEKCLLGVTREESEAAMDKKMYVTGWRGKVRGTCCRKSVLQI